MLSASFFGCFAPIAHCIGDWVGPSVFISLLIIIFHTNQVYCNTNYRLLEKPRCLRNSHLDRGMQTQKGNQRRRRNPITSENSEVSTEPESLR